MVKNHYDCDQCGKAVPKNDYAYQLKFDYSLTGLIKENRANMTPNVERFFEPQATVWHFCSVECLGKLFDEKYKETLAKLMGVKAADLVK